MVNSFQFTRSARLSLVFQMAQSLEPLAVAKRGKGVWNGSKSVQQNARAVLPAMAAKYLKASRRLAGEHPSPRALHKFRLRTKRSRYTLELFRPCYAPGLNSRLEAFRRIQQCLGEINDCATTRQLLFGRKVPSSGPLAKFARFLDSRASEKTAALLRLLQRSLHAPARKPWWTGYLADPDRGRKGAPTRRY